MGFFSGRKNNYKEKNIKNESVITYAYLSVHLRG